jgi:hypothetical protein
MDYDLKINQYRKRKTTKELCVEYKGGKCEICGYKKCFNALEFHHISDLEKDFSISEKQSFDNNMKNELDKCVLVCANCHREIHDGLHHEYLDTGSIYHDWD